jgi:hypothetical protein
MAENDENGEKQTGSIDYSGKQADIDKAKQKAHEADRERLAEESK